MGASPTMGGHWSPSFSRQLHNWELVGVEAFLLRQQRNSIKRDVEDRAVLMA